MSVDGSDLQIYLSAAGSSDGGAMSATVLPGGLMNGLWPDVGSPARIAGGSQSKKWYVANEHGSDALIQPSLYLAVQPVGMVEYYGLGADSADDTDLAQGNMTAWSANAKIALVASGADGRQATCVGINNSGVPISEVVTLNGTSEVLSVATFSKVLKVELASLSGSVTVTVKQGTGGATRGTIGLNKKLCWLWVNPTTVSTGLILPDLPAGSHYGIWDKETWAAGVASHRDEHSTLGIEETA